MFKLLEGLVCLDMPGFVCEIHGFSSQGSKFSWAWGVSWERTLPKKSWWAIKPEPSLILGLRAAREEQENKQTNKKLFTTLSVRRGPGQMASWVLWSLCDRVLCWGKVLDASLIWSYCGTSCSIKEKWGLTQKNTFSFKYDSSSLEGKKIKKVGKILVQLGRKDHNK